LVCPSMSSAAGIFFGTTALSIAASANAFADSGVKGLSFTTVLSAANRSSISPTTR
jgi:hypothetical protein